MREDEGEVGGVAVGEAVVEDATEDAVFVAPGGEEGREQVAIIEAEAGGHQGAGVGDGGGEVLAEQFARLEGGGVGTGRGEAVASGGIGGHAEGEGGVGHACGADEAVGGDEDAGFAGADVPGGTSEAVGVAGGDGGMVAKES